MTDYIDAIDVYSQYFNAHCIYEGKQRNAALVKLTVLKDIEGILSYEVNISFMPYEDEEDFRVPTDAYYSKVIASGSKRRNKNNEKKYIDNIKEEIDSLIKDVDEAVVYWDRPLRQARLG